MLGLQIKIAKYRPFRGSSYIALPAYINNKKACINVQNNDEKCFQWALLSALFPVPSKDHPNRTSKYESHVGKLDWSGINFPTPVPQARVFEKNNSQVSINIFEWKQSKKTTERSERQGTYRPLYHTDQRREKHVDLLLISEGDKYHYVWIRSFNRLMYDQSKHKENKFFCTNCFHACTSQAVLDKHLADCKGNGWSKAETVDKIIKFENHKNELPTGFVIYADSEALIERMFSTTKKKENQESFTVDHQLHVPCSFAYITVRRCCSETKVHGELKLFRGATAAEDFLKAIVANYYELQKIIDEVKPLKMTADDHRIFDRSTHCHICHGELEDPMTKVRDHCHLCGKFRGAAHSLCNLKLSQTRTVSCFFHNFRGYDAHPIMRALGAIKDRILQVSCIPMSTEKYTAVSLKLKADKPWASYELVFKDSFQFLSASLDKLVANSKDFKCLKHMFPIEDDFSLLLRKGVYPYEYMDGWDKFSELCLPAIDKFSSTLKGDVFAEDYEHARRVWEHFKCQNIGEYHDLYLKTDVLLLADVFESFRSLSLQVYGLDPCHYFTSPGLSWDAALKITKAELPTLKDRDMHDMIARGVRGGVSMITHRYAKANNQHLPDYDPTKPSEYLIYLDANNLYGNAMVEKLPYSDFHWMDKVPDDWSELKAKLTPENGYILEVDLEYPYELHDEHNDYPLAPENLEIKPEMLSEYNKICVEQEDGSIDKEALNAPARKLVTSFTTKERYVVHYKNLLYYESKGLRVKRVHRVVQFKEKAWLKEYILQNTDLRTKAKSEFEKDFYKLMNNSVFGKTMENVWRRVNIKLVTNEEKARKLISSPWFNYGTFKIFTKDLVAVHMPRKKVILDKPIYTGFSVLELSKLHMYGFHYDVVKARYGSKAKLLFTDTDSLCYAIKTTNLYGDLVSWQPHLDTSDYPKDHPLYSIENKKKLGKFKDELNGKLMQEFVGLRSKLYAYSKLDGTEEKKAKGVSKSVIKQCLSVEQYKAVLFEKKQTRVTMNIIRSKLHKNIGTEVNKIALSPFDDKRYVQGDGVCTLAYGHWRIRST